MVKGALDRATIIMNFQQAKAQADRLDGIANNITKLSDSELESIMNSLNANWKGDNATAYLGKGEKLQKYMDDTANSLHSIAEEIRNIAQRIYNAEMANLAIAESRTSG